jgi:hypothetical protein
MLSSVDREKRFAAGRQALLAAASVAMASPAAHAVGVSGQGPWETTLLARDLDGNAATAEAYYDTDFGYNITSVQSELAHLYYVTLGNKGDRDVLGNIQSGAGLSNTGPFGHFTVGDTIAQYWTGAERPSGRGAWYFSLFAGQQGYNLKFNQYRAWAAHPGDMAAIPEPQAFLAALAGLAVLGALARKRRA